MLPTLEEFNIVPPVFIRKLDKQTDWHPEVSSEERPNRTAELAFPGADRTFSLYCITNAQEFHSTIVALNALRSPQNQNTDFIWITGTELVKAGIEPELYSEGDCQAAQGLHFNAQVTTEAAVILCQILILADRNVYRCRKQSTTAILNQRRDWGCKALINNSLQCQCEK